jgi:hypothetical protein
VTSGQIESGATIHVLGSAKANDIFCGERARLWRVLAAARRRAIFLDGGNSRCALSNMMRKRVVGARENRYRLGFDISAGLLVSHHPPLVRYFEPHSSAHLWATLMIRTRVNTRVATTRCVVIRTAPLKVKHVKN